jgi:alkaline phosphatase
MRSRIMENASVRARFILAVFLTVSMAAGGARAAGGDGPENIILLIGDGMGVAHLTFGHIASGQLQAARMPVGGLILTFPYDGMVTDSAASGTAMATGFKTRNGMISISPGGDTLRTVLEAAEERGMSTGLVATSSITHATPAVFAAHVESRSMEAEIARQMTGSGLDLLIGGGLAFFVPRSVAGSRRADELDLLSMLRERMTVVRSVPRLMELEGEKAAALLAPAECPPAGEREYSLGDLTASAIRILSVGGAGFFLMVEGSQIDWAAHDNDDEGILSEMLDFDGAVGVALDFAEKDGRTLIIMTADHETGGFALNESEPTSSRMVEPAFTSGGHTMEMVPILAYGPGAEPFGGIHDNTFIGKRLIEYVSRR